MRLGLVMVFAPDLDEAEGFYRDTLDLAPGGNVHELIERIGAPAPGAR